jgi:CheY-like chemotaxis protein
MVRKQKCILVIDDEPDIRDIAKLSIQITRQWDTLIAINGSEGVAIARDQQPDVILLDVIMPEFDGLATLKVLKSEPTTAHIPVILLTATAKLAMQDDFLQAGAQGIITKPFDPGTLAEQIETLLAWRSVSTSC